MRYLLTRRAHLTDGRLFRPGRRQPGRELAGKIPISQMYVTIRNESGLALNDVSIAIVPMGRTTIYNKFLGRLENAQSRNVMLGDLSAATVRRLVCGSSNRAPWKLKGKDVNGKDYSVEIAWR